MTRKSPANTIAPRDADFNADSEMKDVEIFHISDTRVLAKGKRFGRFWLLRGLPPEKRSSPEALRSLEDEFNRRFRPTTGEPLTVGIEFIGGIGPCIVEEWRDDSVDRLTSEEVMVNRTKSRRRLLKRIILSLILTALAGGIVYVYSSIERLTEDFRSAQAKLEKLETAHREGEETMMRLADSLDRAISKPLIPESYAELRPIRGEDPFEKLISPLIKIKLKEFDRELERYDRFVIPKVKTDFADYLDSMAVLYRSMREIGAGEIPDSSYRELTEYDRILLSHRLYGRYMMRFGEHVKKWIPIVSATSAEQEKNNNRERKDERD